MLVVFAFLLHGAKKSVIKIQEANRCEYFHSFSYVKAPYGYMYCLAHSQTQIPKEGLN